MELWGMVTFISTKGLGGEYEMSLYISKDGKMYVISQMNGKYIQVKWIEEYKSVTYFE